MTGAEVERPDALRTPPRHRPLIPVLAGFALGIALDSALLPPLSFWALLGAATALVVLWGARRGLAGWGNWLLAGFLLLPLGGLDHALRTRSLPPWHVRNLAPDGKQVYFLRGVVSEAPRSYYTIPAFRGEDEPVVPRWAVAVRLEGISADRQSWQRTAGGLTVFVDGGRPALCVGDRVEFLSSPAVNRPPSNPGETDRRLIFERAGSYGTASVGSPEAFHVTERARWYTTFPRATAALRSFLTSRMDEVFGRMGQEERSGIVMALLFGERGRLTPEQDDLLRESGTLQFLAISGLHVGLFCVFVGGLLAALGLAARARAMLVIVLIWGYVMFTGSQVSALRAGWMLTFVLAAPLFERRRDSLSALAGAAVVILILSPQSLFNAGFQLTFVAVWAIVCIYPQLEGILWPWKDFVAQVQRPEERTVWSDLLIWSRSYLLLSLTVWVATAPILAYDFHLLCFLAPVLNLVVWPLVLVLLLVCFLLAVCLPISMGAAALLAGPALFLSGDIEAVLRGASHLPGFGVYMPAPPLWWIGIFYAALGLWVVRKRIPGGRGTFVAAAAVVGLTYLGNAAALRSAGEFRLTIADVGAGQAVLAEVPGGRAMLLDAGSFRQSAEDTVSEMLWHERVGRINVATVSHMNNDHCSLLPCLCRRFRVEEVVLPASGQISSFATRVRQTLRRLGVSLRPLMDGAEITGGGLRCIVLHPDARFAGGPALPENERGLVLRCTYGELSFLLPGDIQELAMQRLCRDHGDSLRSDLLVMPHHGHCHPGLEEFLARVHPAVAVVSGPEDGVDPATVAVLERMSIPLWITGREGAIIATVAPGVVRLTGHRSGRTAEYKVGDDAGGPSG